MFLLLGTSCCHLCEQAAAMAAEILSVKPVAIREIDIVEHIEWQADYVLRIPVLLHKDPVGP